MPRDRSPLIPLVIMLYVDSVQFSSRDYTMARSDVAYPCTLPLNISVQINALETLSFGTRMY